MTEHSDDIAFRAGVLSDALPFMRRYAGRTIVVKYGGHAMGDEALAAGFAHDVVLLKQIGVHPVVVHGGGPQIGQMLDRLKIQSSFVDGLRVTDQNTVEIVEMVLSGSINKQIVGLINAAGGTAIGLSGKDGELIRARKLTRTARDPDSNIERVLDLGFVGEPVAINSKVLTLLETSDIIPVIAPIGTGAEGETYNINADTAAGAIAAALHAKRLLMLTDTAGVPRRRSQGDARDQRGRGARDDPRRHDPWRHDPQDRDLPGGGRDRCRSCRNPRRSPPARHPGRTALQRRRGNIDQAAPPG